MSHIMLLYALPDHKFARQLAVQIEQRGMVIWPVPEMPPTEAELDASRARGLEEASHVLGILSPHASTSTDLHIDCQRALDQDKRVIAILPERTPIPEYLWGCTVVNFEGQFLVAFEELSGLLEKSHAPTRPLTVEHPPPVAKPGLLPIMFPSERCWREDRLRISYSLPIILTRDELEIRLPAFLVASGFELTESTRKRLVAQRINQKYPLFDPRRADHTLSVERRRGRLRVYYQMTRTQVYHWFPAHYRMMDREAAALYRYLATGRLDDIFIPVSVQARRARFVSVIAWVALVLLTAFLIFLIAI